MLAASERMQVLSGDKMTGFIWMAKSWTCLRVGVRSPDVSQATCIPTSFQILS